MLERVQHPNGGPLEAAATFQAIGWTPDFRA